MATEDNKDVPAIPLPPQDDEPKLFPESSIGSTEPAADAPATSEDSAVAAEPVAPVASEPVAPVEAAPAGVTPPEAAPATEAPNPYGAAPQAPAANPYEPNAYAAAPQPYGANPYATGAPALPQGISIAALICGIGGLVLSFAWLGFLPALAGVILGHMGQKRQPYAKGFWLTGMITGYAGVAFSVIGVIIVVAIFGLSAASTGTYGY